MPELVVEVIDRGLVVHVLQSFGSQPKVECALRRYVARRAYGIATDADAVAAFTTEFPDARAVLARAGVR